MVQENIESLENLWENLEANGLDPQTMPLVFQWNKRDLEETIPIDEMEDTLNPDGLPSYEAVAIHGKGVFTTLKAVAQQVIQKLNKQDPAELDESEDDMAAADAGGIDPLPSPGTPVPTPASPAAVPGSPSPSGSRAGGIRVGPQQFNDYGGVDDDPGDYTPEAAGINTPIREHWEQRQQEEEDLLGEIRAAEAEEKEQKKQERKERSREAATRRRVVDPFFRPFGRRFVAGLLGAAALPVALALIFSEGLEAGWSAVLMRWQGADVPTAPYILAGVLVVLAVLLCALFAALQDRRSLMRVFQIGLAWYAAIVLGAYITRQYVPPTPEISDSGHLALALAEASATPMKGLELREEMRAEDAATQRDLVVQTMAGYNEDLLAAQQQVAEMKAAEGETQALKEQIGELEGQIATLQTQVTTVTAERDDLRRARQEDAKQLQQIQRLQDIAATVSLKDNEIQDKNKQIEALTQQRDQLVTRIQELEKQVEKLKEQNDTGGLPAP
jgi:hypothetical protein